MKAEETACPDCCPEGDYLCDRHEFAGLLEFCASPEVDTLLHVESEGGSSWEFDAKGLVRGYQAALTLAQQEARAAALSDAVRVCVIAGVQRCITKIRALLEGK